MDENIKVERLGHSTSDRIRFEWLCDSIPSEDAMAKAQARVGYNPCGYGGPWDVSTAYVERGRWLVSWTCAASCD